MLGALLASDPSGETWLGPLLAITPGGEALPETVRRAPGRLSGELAQPRRYRDRILGRTIALPRCFEHSAPPSRAFLRWLIEHPDELTWPERTRGERTEYGAETQRRREALVDGPADARAAVQSEAVSELARLGPERSRRKWWAFEGHTEVDCWLETDRLLLFVEGKRNEPISPSTQWYPRRNQLVRNLEVVGELARGRAAAVLLISEKPAPELSTDDLRGSTPHLDDDEGARETLASRYLGQTTWRKVCAALDVDYAALPETTADVAW